MNDLIPLEHNNQRILTTQQLADSYETTPDVITKNFNRNKARYQEGKHYYALSGHAKHAFLNLGQFDSGLKNAAVLYLWTERGAMLHAKSLGTDRAWTMYEELVEFYFQAKENQFAIPQTLPEALRLAADLEEDRQRLIAEAARKDLLIGDLQPKADYFDELVDRNLLTSLRDTAKEFRLKPKAFNQYLLDHRYIFRNPKGELRPYAQHISGGLFELKEGYNPQNGWVGPQTMVTPKGRETFRLLTKCLISEERE